MPQSIINTPASNISVGSTNVTKLDASKVFTAMNSTLNRMNQDTKYEEDKQRYEQAKQEQEYDKYLKEQKAGNYLKLELNYKKATSNLDSQLDNGEIDIHTYENKLKELTSQKVDLLGQYADKDAAAKQTYNMEKYINSKVGEKIYDKTTSDLIDIINGRNGNLFNQSDRWENAQKYVQNQIKNDPKHSTYYMSALTELAKTTNEDEKSASKLNTLLKIQQKQALRSEQDKYDKNKRDQENFVLNNTLNDTLKNIGEIKTTEQYNQLKSNLLKTADENGMSVNNVNKFLTEKFPNIAEKIDRNNIIDAQKTGKYRTTFGSVTDMQNAAKEVADMYAKGDINKDVYATIINSWKIDKSLPKEQAKLIRTQIRDLTQSLADNPNAVVVKESAVEKAQKKVHEKNMPFYKDSKEYNTMRAKAKNVSNLLKYDLSVFDAKSIIHKTKGLSSDDKKALLNGDIKFGEYSEKGELYPHKKIELNLGSENSLSMVVNNHLDYLEKNNIIEYDKNDKSKVIIKNIPLFKKVLNENTKGGIFRTEKGVNRLDNQNQITNVTSNTVALKITPTTEQNIQKIQANFKNKPDAQNKAYMSLVKKNVKYMLKNNKSIPDEKAMNDYFINLGTKIGKTGKKLDEFVDNAKEEYNKIWATKKGVTAAFTKTNTAGVERKIFTDPNTGKTYIEYVNKAGTTDGFADTFDRVFVNNSNRLALNFLDKPLKDKWDKIKNNPQAKSDFLTAMLNAKLASKGDTTNLRFNMADRGKIRNIIKEIKIKED